MANDFLSEQEKAVRELKEMSRRANQTHHMPPAPPFVRINQNFQRESSTFNTESSKKATQSSGLSELLGGFNLPFLGDIKSDGDIGLILGLLLILLSEKSDRLLLLALLYILM